MTHPSALLARLAAIGQSVAATGRAQALLGLGSVGVERDRLDAYSDLDFFVIAQTGQKHWFLQDLTWLNSIAPLAFAFQNTVDGYKVLFEDEIFCEWAVFEADELARIPFAAGQIVWQNADFDPAIVQPQRSSTPPSQQSAEWLLGEALTNLYIGMGRYQRGEKLSAMRFVQSYAVDCILKLASRLQPTTAVHRDQFAFERRYEQQFPNLAPQLALWMQGYDHTPESALALLDFAEQHWDVNPLLAAAIRRRC